VLDGRPGASLAPVDFDKLKADLEEKHGETMRDTDVMSAALYPKVFDEYAEFKAKYGPVDKLDTATFLVGPGIEEEINVSKSAVTLLLSQRFHSASYALRGICYGCVSVCLSQVSSTKTAKCRMTQTRPHDSSGTLVFRMPKIF